MQKITIIAEAGINHNGSIKKAFQLVDVAKKANADFVKFQTYKTNNLVLPNAKKAKYQMGRSNENQFQMLKNSELSYGEFYRLYQYTKKKKIKYDYVVELMCTNPLKISYDIDRVIKKIFPKNEEIGNWMGKRGQVGKMMPKKLLRKKITKFKDLL